MPENPTAANTPVYKEAKARDQTSSAQTRVYSNMAETPDDTIVQIINAEAFLLPPEHWVVENSKMYKLEL